MHHSPNPHVVAPNLCVPAPIHASQLQSTHPGLNPHVPAPIHTSRPRPMHYGPSTHVPAFVHMSWPHLHPLASHCASPPLSCIPHVSRMSPASPSSSAS